MQQKGLIIMKYALFGGDDRIVILRRLLIADGHDVKCFALEKAITGEASAENAAAGADCVILPLPCERDGFLNAPYCENKYYICDLLDTISPGTIVCAGKASCLEAECEKRSLLLQDYFAREDFAVLNADLTAEGTTQLIMRNSKSALRGKSILICGFGRIGKLLALKLLAFGAKITVAARSSGQLAWAKCIGCETRDLSPCKGERFDFVVNTIPHPLFGADFLSELRGATLIELASAPHGFSQEEASALKLELILALGLPSVCTPISAGGIIRDIIYGIMEELK